MGSKEILAGNAAVFVQLRDQLFRDGLRGMVSLSQNAASQMTAIGAGLTAFGAGVTGTVLRAVSVFSTYGQTIDDAAQRTGFSAEAVSELGFAIEQSGGDMATFEAAAKKMQQSITGAREGSAGAVASFESLGISVDTLAKLAPDKQFELIAQKLSEIDDPATRTTRSLELFGKAGQKLQPLISGGADAISELRTQARDLGVSMSGADAAAAGAYGDAWDTVTKSLRGVQVTVGAAVAPVLTDLFNTVAGGLGIVSNFVSQNRELVVNMASSAAAIAAAGTGLTTLGLSLKIAGSGLGVITSFATSIPVVGAALGALLSPIGLIAAGLAAAGVVFLTFTDTGRAMGRTVGQVFTVLRETVLDSIGTIRDQLAGGDWIGALNTAWGAMQEAAGVIWDGIKLIVLQAVEGIRSAFPGLVANVTQAWNDLTSVTSAAWTAVRDTIVSVWGTISTFVTDAWNNTVSGVNELTGGVVTAITGYFGQVGSYFQDVTGNMFDSWADFVATMQNLWADAGTFILRKILDVASGMLDAFANVGEFLAGDNFISNQLRDAKAQVDDFNKNVQQGGQDRRDEIERNRQKRIQEAAQIQQQQVGTFTSQIADLQSKLSSKIEIPKIASPLGNVESDKKKLQSAVTGLKPPQLEFKFSSAGSFSAAAGQIIGNNRPQTVLVRQNEKMIGLLGKIADNTDSEDVEVL